jgi:hypothetical protein
MKDQDVVKDVQRKVHERMNKYADKLVFGYRPKNEFADKKEGDVWEDSDGRKWTIKNGIKQNVTKLDSAKIPLWCPECENAMKHRLDTKYYLLRGKCMDCVIKEETEMRRLGLWEQYEKDKERQNYIAFLKDKIAELQYYHDSVSIPEIIHADGEKILMIEKWHVDVDKIRADLSEDIQKLKEALAKAESGEEDEPSETV